MQFPLNIANGQINLSDSDNRYFNFPSDWTAIFPTSPYDAIVVASKPSSLKSIRIDCLLHLKCAASCRLYSGRRETIYRFFLPPFLPSLLPPIVQTFLMVFACHVKDAPASIDHSTVVMPSTGPLSIESMELYRATTSPVPSHPLTSPSPKIRAIVAHKTRRIEI